MNMTINANLRGRPAVSVLGNCSVGTGKFQISGNMDVYFANGDLWDKYKAGTASSLQWETTDGAGNKYTWHIPNIKFSADKINGSGENTDVIEKLSFTGLYDATEAAAFELIREPA